MAFMKKFRAGLKGAAAAMKSDRFEVNGVELKCIHCGFQQFDLGSAQLNTAAMSLLNLDWANESAAIACCKRCSFIMWFAESPEKIY